MLGPLGTRHVVLDAQTSQFTLVDLSGSLTLGGIQGQTNGQTGQPGFLDLQAGAPDSSGLATVSVTAASDYLYVDARPQAPLVVCLRPLLPVNSAGVLQCNGGFDFSIDLTQNHHLGQIGVDMTANQCSALGGSVESSPHPDVCNGPFVSDHLGADSGPGALLIAAIPALGLTGLPVELTDEQALPCGDEGSGTVGVLTFTSAAFRTTILNANNMTGSCGAGMVGAACTSNAQCDSAPAAGDGVCGALLRYESEGHSFACSGWAAGASPGCLVFSSPQLHASPLGADLITALSFCE